MAYASTELQTRDQALISLCNDIGCRISEALTLNLGSLHEKTTPDGKVFLVITFRKSKTQTRTVIGYLCMPFVKRWLSIHKNKENENSPLFPDKWGNRMAYAAALMMLNRGIEKAGILLPHRKKLHVFRHLFSTRTKAWPRDIKNYWFGWIDSPFKSQRYTHISPDDLAPYYFGLLEKENNPMMPKQCICGAWNVGGDHCITCGKDLKAFTFLNNKTFEDKIAKIVLEEIDEKNLDAILSRVVEKRLQQRGL